MPAITFTAVGHLTNDELEDGLHPGGSALYAALVARQLGAEATVVTAFGDDCAGRSLLAEHGIHVQRQPGAITTRFRERYLQGRRTAQLLARAPMLVPPTSSSRVLFACPVIGELPLSGWQPGPRTLLAAGLQGWLRAIGPEGRILPQPLPAPELLQGFDAAFCSEEDLGQDDARVLERLRRAVPLVVVTAGAQGARLWHRGQGWRIHALPTAEVDPTGAGDAFAAAFLCSWAQERSLLECAVHATCAASVVIEGTGPSSIPRLRQLAEVVERYRSTVPAPARMD